MEIRKLTKDSGEIPALERINEEAIPENERCTLDDLLATGATVFCIDEDQKPVGFMVVRMYRDLIYLAFFAVRADLRSRGIGGRALRELIRRNPGKQVVVEYEAPEQSNEMNLRRKQFYLRNGFHATGWYTCYDGIEFEVGCSGGDFDSEGFSAFAADLARVITDHIPNPFQKTTM